MEHLAIHTDRLTRKFQNICAVDSVSLNVERGTIYGLLGPGRVGQIHGRAPAAWFAGTKRRKCAACWGSTRHARALQSALSAVSCSSRPHSTAA